MQAQIDASKTTLPPPLATIPATWNDFSKRTPIHVLRRGIWENKLEPVGPRPPSVLVSAELPELAADVSNPRTQLADWLTDPQNPLRGPRDRQSALAAALRHGHRQDGQRLRPARRAAQPSRVARLAGRRRWSTAAGA